MMNAAQLGQLVEDHAAALALYARQWSDAPEDVVQEAFLKLVTEKTRPASAPAWLFRIVRNLAISELRKTQRRRRHEKNAAAQAPACFLPADHGGLDAELAAVALQSLPAEEREVITLHLWGGLNFVDIAAVVGSSHSTVHRWYGAGLSKLRERLNVPCPNLTKRN